MDIRHELEQLRSRIRFIEGDLAETRRRLEQLEARAERVPEKSAPPLVVAPPPLPPRPVPTPQPVTVVTIPRPTPTPATPAAIPAFPAVSARMPAPERVATDADESGREVGSAGSGEWREWLRRLQLWPPEEAGENQEVRLGAWWATRIGTLLAVIGVVFFGVYVSLATPPWVKFVELLVTCSGVALAGLWLERRMPRFGSVVFAGGLALLYFCAFAGHALPAVRVLANPVAAVAWQAAAVLLIAGAAVRKRSALIATMAVGLGYVTAVFSRSGGLHDFALVMAALLAVVAVGFHRRARWEAPSVVALPGAYAVYALVWESGWLGIGPGARAWLYLGGVATLFLLRDWRGRRAATGARAETAGAGERWFQGGNSSLALALGTATALVFYRAELAVFYFGAAVWLGAAAALRRRQLGRDAISAVLLAKAAGAVTLGVIEVADGRTTALALLVQAAVMAFGAKRLGSRVLGVGSGLVAAAASGFFFVHAGGPVPLLSWRAAGAFAFVAGLAWLATAGRRAVEDRSAGLGAALEATGAVIAAGAALVTLRDIVPAGWAPALAVAVAASLAAGGAWRRAWAPVAAAVLLGVAAHLGLWQLAEGATERPRLLLNAAAVLAPSAMLAAWLGGRARFELAAAAVGAATIASFTHGLFATVEPGPALAGTMALALFLSALAPGRPLRHLPWLATLATVLGMVFWREAGGAQAPASAWLVAALAGAWALPVALHASRGRRAALETEPAAGWATGLQLAAATLITLHGLAVWFGAGGFYPAVCALAALGVFALRRWPGIAAGLEFSWIFWAAALWSVLRGKVYPEFGYTWIWPTIAALAAWVPAWVLARVPAAEADAGRRGRLGAGAQTWIATVLAALVCVRVFDDAGRLVAWLGALAAAVCALRLGRVMAARAAAVSLGVLAWAGAAWLVAEGGAEGAGAGLAATLAVAVGLVALPPGLAGPGSTATGRAGLRWAFGLAGLELVFVAAVAQRGALDPYATVGWGLGAIGLFMAGLFARIRPYRLLGLLGLALCLPRVFLVDLSSALHRIAAFVVLGLVLLWVGFSYHRFRHLIASEREDTEA
jgi:hypothetical protein